MRQQSLDRYFKIIDQRAPAAMSRFIRWIREPSMIVLRWVIAIFLVLGGVFSFLPVLGVWMLPLGLLLIAEDVPFLRDPLLRSFAWTERKWDQVKTWWSDRNQVSENASSIRTLSRQDNHADGVPKSSEERGHLR